MIINLKGKIYLKYTNESELKKFLKGELDTLEIFMPKFNYKKASELFTKYHNKELTKKDILEFFPSFTENDFSFIQDSQPNDAEYTKLFNKYEKLNKKLFSQLIKLNENNETINKILEVLKNRIKNDEEEKDNFGKNAYRYYANKYLAVQAAKAEDYAKGADLIAEAYKYYPVNEQCLKDLAEAAAIEDAKERYEKYYHCTTIQYNFWEERKVAVIDRS